MKKLLMIVMALLLLALVATSLANDYWGGPPPENWTRFDPNSTWQHWTFSNPGGLIPDEWYNLYGTPVLEFVGNWIYEEHECDPSLDPAGFVGGFHCESPEGGQIILTIPNDPQQRLYKSLFIQITSSEAPTNIHVETTGEIVITPHTGSWSTGRPHVSYPGPAPYGGVWYTYNYGRYIIMNPEGETVTIDVPYCTVVEQIVVDTICSDDPVAEESNSWGDVKALFR